MQKQTADMLKFLNYDILFQEIPDEITLAINITGCPNRCKGCHSPILTHDTGEELNESVLSDLIRKYAASITCVCFMGGDGAPEEIARLAGFVRQKYELKTGWYSGRERFPADRSSFDYVKLGRYIESRGGLRNRRTNQRLFRIIAPDRTEDLTERFWK